MEKATAEANAKAEKKAISKARRQAKRDEAKREAERRAEVRQAEENQRKQRKENITGVRTDKKETKSQRKQRKRLERQAEQAESQRVAHERAQRRRNPRKERKQAKRHHRNTKKEERLRQRLAKPTLLSFALDENVQRWFISGRGHKIPNVFLNYTENNVKKVVDKVNGPKKVYTILKCELVKHDPKTGERMYTEFHGRSKTHTITTQLGDTYEEMKGKMLESLAKFQKVVVVFINIFQNLYSKHPFEFTC